MGRVAVLAAAAVLAGAACGGSDEATVAPAGDAAADVFEVVAPSIARVDVDLAGFAGRDVVVWFWSPW